MENEQAEGVEQTPEATEKPKRKARKKKETEVEQQVEPPKEETESEAEPDVETPTAKKRKLLAALRDATTEERALIDSKGQTCYKIKDMKGGKSRACPNDRAKDEIYCPHHGGGELPTKAITPESAEETTDMAKKTKKVSKYKMPAKKVGKKKERKPREEKVVAINKSSKWKEIEAKQRGSVLEVVNRLGKATGSEVAKALKGRACWANMEGKGLLEREVRTTISNLQRLGFLKFV